MKNQNSNKIFTSLFLTIIFFSLFVGNNAYGFNVENNSEEVLIENINIVLPPEENTANTTTITNSEPIDNQTTSSTTVTTTVIIATEEQSPTSSVTISLPMNLIPQSDIDSAVHKILNYLKSQQNVTGTIIDGTITDWSIISFGAHNEYADEIKQVGGQSLLDYEKKYNLDDPSDMNSCATYPRHILALLSAGVNLNDSAIQGLKEKMTTVCYKDGLYGLNGINDDVFALLALLAVGEDYNQPIIQSNINTIKSWQIDNGAFSWPDWNDPSQKTAGDDITGASINALKYAQTKGADIDNEIFAKAKSYLKTTQQTDGGWGYGTSDVMTTSWVLMGINSLGEGQNEWFTINGTNPWYPLVNQLKDDGHYESAWTSGVDWFAMKHAVPALTGKSWPIVLPEKIQDFSQGATFTYGSGGGSGYTPQTEPPTTTTTITTTTTVASTTLIATSTLEINMSTSTTTTIETTNTTSTDKLNTQKEKIDTPLINIKPLNTKSTQMIAKAKKTNNPSSSISETLTSGISKNEKITEIINELPIDTSHKNSAKKILAVSGGGAAVLGIYLGLRLIKNVV